MSLAQPWIEKSSKSVLLLSMNMLPTGLASKTAPGSSLERCALCHCPNDLEALISPSISLVSDLVFASPDSPTKQARCPGR